MSTMPNVLGWFLDWRQNDGYRALTPPTKPKGLWRICNRNVVRWMAMILACSFLIILPSPIYKSHDISTVSTRPMRFNTTDRPLITYVYSESELSHDNFVFFVAHGLHAAADFVFIFNGDTSVSKLLPKASNIRIVKRDNSCYDLGAHSEVLLTDGLWKRYKRFILMNSSVRGPFMPHWSEACWSDRFLNKVTEKVKLVGMTLNCWPTPHVQSMVWATDAIGLSLLFYPPPNTPSHYPFLDKIAHGPEWELPADWKPPSDIDPPDVGINACFENRDAAIEAEVGATGVIVSAGYKVDVMLTRFQSNPDYFDKCEKLGSWDVQGPGAYDGISVHPFETMFIKTNRGIEPRMIELFTLWTDGAKFTSYDYC